MQQYIDLVQKVLQDGVEKEQRAVLLSSTQRPTTRSIFGHQMRFDLTKGFPLVTTKKISFSKVKGELLWFLSGSTNENDAQTMGVPFWKEWSDPETGDLGPIYGKQWRRWQGPSAEVDQIANLVRDIREVSSNPQANCGRRLIVSAWNPADQPTRAPAACHTLFQCNVTNGRLSTHLYQRSADVVLGVPFNIACYSLLTHLLADVTGLGVHEFIHSFGDAHIYSNLLDGARTIADRTPKALPTLHVKHRQELDEFEPDDITIDGYDPWPAVGGEVAV